MITNYALYLGLVLCLFSSAFANSAPTVSSITASQRTDGSGVVDISYTLTDTDNDKCTVSVLVSNDGGNTWTITPSSTALSGDKTNVAPGRRKISWNSKVDLPGAFGSNYRVKVTADDNYGPSGMVWVYINDPGVSGHEGFTGYMSKYETTNAQYCQYLNVALASGDITVSGNYIYGANGANNGADFIGKVYYNLAGAGSSSAGATNGGAARINFSGGKFTVDNGFENHPVTYVSWYGATAFCNYYGYRLPTEWEWTAVADYHGSFIYGCGTTINSSNANYIISAHPNGTSPVGAFGEYGYGLCDMAGNITEWVSNLSGTYHKVRGGSWGDQTSVCSVSFSNSANSDLTNYGLGFRVCR